jgi:acetoin utilization deacetylase AcuC-like enzyme
MADVGIVRDPRYLDHRTPEGHPEFHRRLASLYEMLDALGPDNGPIPVPPRMAEREEILTVHTPEYLDRVAATSGREQTALTADTIVSAGSYTAALLSAGGLFAAIDRVVSGELDAAFTLARPPGHHAERSRAMGFCLFNNVALGARYAQIGWGLKRVLIVDWDVHHGNGTQHIFETDPSVLFFSVHQYPHFPGTGLYTDVGRGPGEGYTLNLPLGKGYKDAEYAALFQRVLRPVALEFGPDLILVSAGFDTHRDDLMGKMKMTPTGFAALTRSLMILASVCCGGKLVLALEGGYHLKALTASVEAVLAELAGKRVTDPAAVADGARRRKVDHALHRCRHVHQGFWKCLRRPV